MRSASGDAAVGREARVVSSTVVTMVGPFVVRRAPGHDLRAPSSAAGVSVAGKTYRE